MGRLIHGQIFLIALPCCMDSDRDMVPVSMCRHARSRAELGRISERIDDRQGGREGY